MSGTQQSNKLVSLTPYQLSHCAPPILVQYNTIQISLFHSDHTNMTYEEYNTTLKGGTYLIDR